MNLAAWARPHSLLTTVPGPTLTMRITRWASHCGLPMTLQLTEEKEAQAQVQPSLQSACKLRLVSVHLHWYRGPVRSVLDRQRIWVDQPDAVCPSSRPDLRVVQSRGGGQFIPTFSSDAADAGNPCQQAPGRLADPRATGASTCEHW